MRAEIIAVGTELLLGQILNTNAQYLARELAALGVDVYYQTVVGDNAARLKESLVIAAKRADFIILTGGLGPTQDDLTRDTTAALTNRGMVLHAPSLAKMVEMARSRGMEMMENNKRMALIVEGSDPLPNDTGTAVGSALAHDNNYYILLPGPPKEMKPMFERYAKFWIRSKLPDETPLFSKILKFSGIGESSLEEKLNDLIAHQEEITIAPYAADGEVTLRLSTKAHTREQAFEKFATIEQTIAERVGDYQFAEEDLSLEDVVIRMLIDKQVTLSAAESCTGGLLSDLITTIPGSSAVFAGGIVCYSNKVKEAQLGIPHEVLEGKEAPGSVSAEVAKLLADNIREQMDTDFGLSITGVAGPEEVEGKPVGTLFIGVAERGQDVEVMEAKLSGSREIIKQRATKLALHLLWQKIRERR